MEKWSNSLDMVVDGFMDWLLVDGLEVREITELASHVPASLRNECGLHSLVDHAASHATGSRALRPDSSITCV